MWRPKGPADLAKVILFLCGLAGMAHEELTGRAQPALIPVYMLMLGLPAFLVGDDWWRRGKDGGEK